MVMKLHTGVPGAGKSYLLIKSYVDAFCKWDKDSDGWVTDDKKMKKLKITKPIRLISNIEGLTLEHENLDALISARCMVLARRRVIENFGVDDDKKKGGRKKKVDLELDEEFNIEKAMLNLDDVAHTYYMEFMEERVRWFFTESYQNGLAEKHTVVYLIEESQRYFDSAELGRKPWVRDVLYSFERHRHAGISFFMDTQHSSKIHRGIVALFEEEIRAKPRTLSVMGEFRYNSFVDGLKTNQVPIVVKPDKRIFAAYQSMTAIEAVKPKKPLFKLVVFLGVVFVLAYCAYRYAIHSIGPKDAVAAETSTVHKVPRRGSGGGVSSPGGSGAVAGGDVQGEWVRVSHLMRANGDVWVIHPVYQSIIPLKDLGLEVKVSGTSLFAWVEAGKL